MIDPMTLFFLMNVAIIALYTVCRRLDDNYRKARGDRR